MAKKLSTQELLASIKVNVSAFLAFFPRHAAGTLSESYTKKGPGRKAKMIRRDKEGNPKQRWKPAVGDNNELWLYCHTPRTQRV